jgi:hypothetical protein
MIVGLRGFNAIHGLWKTARRERGLVGPPNDFYEARGDASTEMDYEQFCAALEAAGVNWLRIKLCGWNNPIGSTACSFEPPPSGTFNLWNAALDPANLAQYRADQHAPPYSPTAWAASNVGQFVAAAERHGVKLDVILFDNVEFSRGWPLHAWNRANRYINDALCQAQDRGFLANAPDAFTDPAALDAARRRIDAALALFEGHEGVVGAWEVMAEQAWITAPDFLGTTWGSPAHVQFINDLRDWNEVLCRYVQARHPAPVGVSNAPANAIRRDSIRVRIFDAPSLDWIGINWYDEANATPVDAHDFLRDAQARWPGKQVVVQQYHPSGPDTTPNESSPWRLSKSFEWTIACGESGMCGGLRWPDIQFATYASPWMREIAGVTAQMAGDAQLGLWGSGRSWDGNVQSADLSLASTWGDGRRMSAFLRWSATPPHQVTVNGLQDGHYRVRWYDWRRDRDRRDAERGAGRGAREHVRAASRPGSRAGRVGIVQRVVQRQFEHVRVNQSERVGVGKRKRQRERVRQFERVGIREREQQCGGAAVRAAGGGRWRGERAGDGPGRRTGLHRPGRGGIRKGGRSLRPPSPLTIE